MALAAPSLLAVESIAGLLFVAVLISAIWQSVSMRRGALASTGDGAAATTASATPDAFQPSPGNIKPVLSSALVLVAFALWLLEADPVMWTLVTLSLIFPAIKLSRIMVDHVLTMSTIRNRRRKGTRIKKKAIRRKVPTATIYTAR